MRGIYIHAVYVYIYIYMAPWHLSNTLKLSWEVRVGYTTWTKLRRLVKMVKQAV